MTWTDAEISEIARRSKIIQDSDPGDEHDGTEDIEVTCQYCEGRGGYPRQVDDEGNYKLERCKICFGEGYLVLGSSTVLPDE